MSAVADIGISAELAAQLDQLHASVLRIKAERDAYRDALLDIALGAEMMLQPNLYSMPNWVERYITEVRRVAREAVK